jgi:hypothetical protein
MSDCKYCGKHVVDDETAGMEGIFELYHTHCKENTMATITTEHYQKAIATHFNNNYCKDGLIKNLLVSRPDLFILYSGESQYVGISDEAVALVIDYMNPNSGAGVAKVEAIKAARNETGWGLRESKEFVEARAAEQTYFTFK